MCLFSALFYLTFLTVLCVTYEFLLFNCVFISDINRKLVLKNVLLQIQEELRQNRYFIQIFFSPLHLESSFMEMVLRQLKKSQYHHHFMLFLPSTFLMMTKT